MDFNWTPFGTNANWGFFIGIKSGILSDLKFDKEIPIRHDNAKLILGYTTPQLTFYTLMMKK
jgi:hypothetical protein